MLKEVYYEHYAENCTGAYWEEERSMPYMVLERDSENREKFREYLENAGFHCVSWNDSYPGILVNTELNRFAMITRACNFEHLNNRDYSIREFIDEILSGTDK